jgi:SGNH hydrolase-like domain, acetyltransferase AlgX
MQSVTFLQRVLLLLLTLILVTPLIFCLLHVLPQRVMPHFLKYTADRVADVYLAGMTIDTPRVPFNSENWWNSSFQHSVESWYRENFGFRRAALRVYNQLLFDVFRSSSVNNSSIVIGKHDELYEWNYIADACGLRAPMSQRDAERLAADLAFVQRQFEQAGKVFVVLITPSKVMTLPDNVPTRLCPNGLSSDTNYFRLLPLLEKEKIRFVDGQAITLAQKPLTNVPVFPVGGTHWGDLADYRVTNALITAINHSRSTHILPLLRIGSQRVDSYPRGLDADLLKLSNLALPHYKSNYLHIDLEKASESQPVQSVTFVGGSFTRGMIGFLASARAADVTLFYYYVLSREVWPRAGASVVYPIGSSRSFAAEFLSSDVVVLEMNVEAIGGNHIRSFLHDALCYFSHSQSHAAIAPAQR